MWKWSLHLLKQNLNCEVQTKIRISMKYCTNSLEVFQEQKNIGPQLRKICRRKRPWEKYRKPMEDWLASLKLKWAKASGMSNQEAFGSNHWNKNYLKVSKCFILHRYINLKKKKKRLATLDKAKINEFNVGNTTTNI